MQRFGLLLFILILLGLAGFFGLRIIKDKVRRDLAQPVAYPSVTPLRPTDYAGQAGPINTSLFVPYWTFKNEIDTNSYDKFIYFGISPDNQGIDRDEAGSANVDEFLEAVPGDKKKLLTLRMINAQNNSAVIKDLSRQNKIINETIAFAKEHDFDGVVLDLEMSAIPFDSLVQQISKFEKQFYTQARKNRLTFGITLYGDTFYRIRPFDVKALAENADEIFIMAYDFHKSNGNPGPNFPLKGKEIYGYDLEKMTDNFLQFSSPKKTTVIFGLFGYDWVVNKSGKSIEKGQPLSYNEINQKFLTECLYTNCSVKRDKQSSETEIKYTDEEGRDHVVWFEDMESVAEKQKYLQKRGISNFSFWANGYF